ncbi:MAG TPA: efflux RND transporter periplasmic adaptor subunit [Stellaceae bacterium]|nr:efflux RND transporter periplasmic adaptor subunit [Stellaceae bacterium]
MPSLSLRSLLLSAALVAATPPALAQQAPAKPPAVGVVPVTRAPVTPSAEYVGRIQAKDRVNLVARVAAFLDQRLFTEGTEVKKGDLLYRLEQGPFQADVQAKQAQIAQFKAQLRNADVTLARAKALLSTPAGQQSNVDAALASQQSLQAQVLGAEAQLAQSQINLDYTEIRAPIDGKIGRTAVTIGNYVNPSVATLATIVSQDPMYVVFSVPTRTVIDLHDHRVVKIRLPDGRLYDKQATLDFVDNTVAANTDSIALRATIENPRLANASGDAPAHELIDGELVTVILEDAKPVEALTVPRAAVLTDQEGDYVFVVDGDDKAQQRRVQLGQSTPNPALAVVQSGLSEGDRVVLDGVQRVRPGQAVSAAPAANPPPTTLPPGTTTTGTTPPASRS